MMAGHKEDQCSDLKSPAHPHFTNDNYDNIYFLGLKKRRRLQMILLLAVSVVGLSLLSGCSGASSTVTNPLQSISTITVAATAGTVEHLTTFVLTVSN